MLVVDDATFEQLGVDRNNLQRTTTEQQAQTINATQPAVNYGVGTPTESAGYDSTSNAYSGAGALDPLSILAGLIAVGALFVVRRASQVGAAS